MKTNTSRKKKAARRSEEQGRRTSEGNQVVNIITSIFKTHSLDVKCFCFWETQEWIAKEISDITVTIVCISPWFLAQTSWWLVGAKPPPPYSTLSLHRVAALKHYNQRDRNINRHFWWNYTPKSFSMKASKTPALFSELILKINSLNGSGK